MPLEVEDGADFLPTQLFGEVKEEELEGDVVGVVYRVGD